MFGERTVQTVQGHWGLEGAAGLGEKCHPSSPVFALQSDVRHLFLHSPVLIIPQVNTFGASNPLTNLVPSLQDVNPDDAFSSVPYEKGFALLYHLEELLGGPGNTCTHLHTHLVPTQSLTSVGLSPSEVFMGFVKSYIQRFAYSSVTTDEWKNYLFTYFKNKVRDTWTLRNNTAHHQYLVRISWYDRQVGSKVSVGCSHDEMSSCGSGGHPEQGGLEHLDVHTWDASCQTSVSGTCHTSIWSLSA